MTDQTLATDRLKSFQTRLLEACKKSSRDPSEITLVAVSKTFPLEAVKEVHALGIREFGENKVIELQEKAPELKEAKWHFIGNLQSNKIKKMLSHTDLFQSLDRLSLAEKIQSQLEENQSMLHALIQVNIGGEKQKSGIAPIDLKTFLKKLELLPRIHIKGLMCLPKKGSEFETREQFRRMKTLFEDLKKKGLLPTEANVLSMGMSQDFPIAIEEGSTMIRVGSAIFGPRKMTS